MPWDVIRVNWPPTGDVHAAWRETIVATCPTHREALQVTARENVPGNGYYW